MLCIVLKIEDVAKRLQRGCKQLFQIEGSETVAYIADENSHSSYITGCSSTMLFFSYLFH